MSKGDSRFSGPWFHGSPTKLDILDAGSWVTPYKEIAKALSHKPTRMSTDDCFKTVKHDGVVPGFLYTLDEEVEDHDLVPLTDETRWQTQRIFRVRLVAAVPILASEVLTS